MNRRQKIIVSITGIFIVLLALVGLTYAYFLTRITGNENPKSISVTTANLQLVYDDGTDGIIGGTNLIPSNTEYTKTFTVKNEGNANVEYRVYLINVINTFERKDDIKYEMTCNTDGTLPCGTANLTTFPSGIKDVVTATIEPNKTHTYTFKFTYKDTGTDQSVDMGKELSAKLQIFTPNKDGEYFPYEEKTLAYNVINNVKNGTLEEKSTFTANLNAADMIYNAPTANLLSTAADDFGTSYYFRGKYTMDNYVNFAGMCWRIVRIQGDGSAKLILASELECSEDNLTNNSGYATNGARGIKGDILLAHYGYNSNLKADYINSPEENETSARTQLISWLNRKITEEEQEFLKNEQWCMEEIKENSFSISFDKLSGTKPISYICAHSKEAEKVDINKVGMLTLDEIVYAGAINNGNGNVTYLQQNAETKEWLTLSLSFRDDWGDYVIDFGKYIGSDMRNVNGYYGLNLVFNSLRPSVSLKSGVTISDGVGTITDPYIIES